MLQPRPETPCPAGAAGPGQEPRALAKLRNDPQERRVRLYIGARAGPAGIGDPAANGSSGAPSPLRGAAAGMTLRQRCLVGGGCRDRDRDRGLSAGAPPMAGGPAAPALSYGPCQGGRPRGPVRTAALSLEAAHRTVASAAPLVMQPCKRFAVSRLGSEGQGLCGHLRAPAPSHPSALRAGAGAVPQVWWPREAPQAPEVPGRPTPSPGLPPVSGQEALPSTAAGRGGEPGGFPASDRLSLGSRLANVRDPRL